jgi:adenine phosphoribosyltransferase
METRLKTDSSDWTRWVRDVPDYPQPGVLFRDLTPLWSDGDAWKRAADALARRVLADGGPRPQFVLGIEARGFLVAQALADRWGAGVLLARKPGKLPRASYRQDYALEYGESGLELHEDPIPEGAPVLIADDVLATGGTASAALELVENLRGQVLGFAFLLEIGALGGRQQLGELPIFTLIRYGANGETEQID